MTIKSTRGSPILVTGAAGDLGAIGRNFAAAGIWDNDELVLLLGNSKTSPRSVVNVVRAVSAIFDDPAQHIGHV
jgi:hypothetical protein